MSEGKENKVLRFERRPGKRGIQYWGMNGESGMGEIGY